MDDSEDIPHGNMSFALLFPDSFYTPRLAGQDQQDAKGTPHKNLAPHKHLWT
jgi:hypothetical protein